MLTPPPISSASILACLRDDFGLEAVRVEFLPLGADLHTAVYRAETQDGRAWFVKLRSGDFEETSVRLPLYLAEKGVPHILAPLTTKSGLPWAGLDDYKVMLYPFIAGVDGYQAALSPAGWREFGASLRRIHDLRLPPALQSRIPCESYTSSAGATIRAYLQRIETEIYTDPTAARAAALLRKQRKAVLELLERAENGARDLQSLACAARETVLCHSDLHAGNLLIQPGGDFYIIDWDDPILALKERDLMFIGGAQGFTGVSPAQEMEFFYRGYGKTQIDRQALTYYRCQRILEDIAIFCEQLLGSTEGGPDREQALVWLGSNFAPGGTIEAAFGGDIFNTDRTD